MTTSKMLVRPLGFWGLILLRNYLDELRPKIVSQLGKLPAEIRPPIASYLRSGATTFAAMEYTDDLLGGRFGVAGGSAMLTDGAFFWRRDTADYVEHYGIALPEEFLALGEKRNWTMPRFSDEEVLALDRYIYDNYQQLCAEAFVT